MEGRENYLRIIAFSTGPALEVIQQHLHNEITLHQPTFEAFLNMTNHKHKLFHEYRPQIPCCECRKLSIAAPYKRGSLEHVQFLKLFDIAANPTHEQRKGQTVIQHCLCTVSAKQAVEVINLDLSLLSVVINHCCYDLTTSRWIQDIKKERNRIAHLGGSTLDNTDFENTWQNLETATLNFARRFGPVLLKRFKREIDQIKTSSIDTNRQLLIDIIESSAEVNIAIDLSRNVKDIETKLYST